VKYVKFDMKIGYNNSHKWIIDYVTCLLACVMWKHWDWKFL